MLLEPILLATDAKRTLSAALHISLDPLDQWVRTCGQYRHADNMFYQLCLAKFTKNGVAVFANNFPSK